LAFTVASVLTVDPAGLVTSPVCAGIKLAASVAIDDVTLVAVAAMGI
jgi:hypothetical protein